MELTGQGSEPGSPLGLLIKDGKFVSEVSWMGHGVQMWLQTLWFLSRTSPDSTVILDEPDVYLHPDLQVKLMRLVRGKYHQTIVTTHSPEIMAEAKPSEMLVVERSRKESNFADTEPVAQQIIDRVGSSYNVKLARLWNAKKFILVEGEDLDYLAIFDSILNPRSEMPLNLLPSAPIGGWGGWHYAIGSTMTIHNFLGQEITTHCILDRDFHTPSQIQIRQDEAKAKKVRLDIWTVKEIENFLLSPVVIARLINLRIKKGRTGPSEEDVATEIDRICEQLKSDIIDGFGQEFLADEKAKGYSNATKRANAHVLNSWKTRETKWSILPGKEAISLLTKWSQAHYGVSFGPTAIAREFKSTEIPRELRALIDRLRQ